MIVIVFITIQWLNFKTMNFKKLETNRHITQNIILILLS